MNQEQIDRLVTDHETWFKDPSKGRRLELSDVNLDRIDLQGRRLIGARLERVTLRQASLQGTKFIRAEITDCDFSNANMENTEFSEAKLESALFTNGNMENVQIHSVDARQCGFDEANLQNSFFVKSSLVNCSFRQARLIAANFRRVYASETTFEQSDFMEANMSCALLTSVDLRWVNVTGAVWNLVGDRKATKIGPAHVHGMKGFAANLDNFILCDLDFSEAADGSDIRPVEFLTGTR